jgi:phosphatidylglycerophosphate synthase
MSVTLSANDAKQYTSNIQSYAKDNSLKAIIITVVIAVILLVAAFFLNILKWALVIIAIILIVTVIVRIYKWMKEKKN